MEEPGFLRGHWETLAKTNGLEIHQPLCNRTLDDEWLYEWWYKERKISLYVADDGSYKDALLIDENGDISDQSAGGDDWLLGLFRWLKGEIE